MTPPEASSLLRNNDASVTGFESNQHGAIKAYDGRSVSKDAQPLNVAWGGHLTLCPQATQHADVMELASAADHIFNATIITVLALLLTLSAGAGLRHPAQV
jgi:hypothetical protein